MTNFMFEMVQKKQSREITTRSNDIWSLLIEAGSALGAPPGTGNRPKISGARGEIEIGVEGGAQVLLRVLTDR